MIILGITGTLGAGKGTVVEYLTRHGFAHFSVRALLEEEMARRGIPVSRDTMTPFANELRAQHGGDYLFRTLLARAQRAGNDAVIESVRTVDEAHALKALPQAVLLAVDADRKLRYARIRARGSALDDVSFEDFVRQEEREMESDNTAEQNLGAVMAMADFVLTNNGTKEALFQNVAKVLAEIRAREGKR